MSSSSGDCAVHVLARTDAIARCIGRWREWEGEDTAETDDDDDDEHFSCRTRLEQPTAIRGRFGATDTRNATNAAPIQWRQRAAERWPSSSSPTL